MRRKYAPNFDGWESVPGESLGHSFTGLTVGHQYLLALTAIDVQGNCDPVFSFDKNLLIFRVVPQGVNGPRITPYNDSFTWTPPFGELSQNPTHQFTVQAPADQPFTLQWSAVAQAGLTVTSYRWAVDIKDIYDETPRRGPHDIRHWSPWSPTIQSATVELFRRNHPEARKFFVEAADPVGLLSDVLLNVQPLVETPTPQPLAGNDPVKQHR
jgi:hypothetical protein